MPFSYSVPLSTFQSLFESVDPALHPELIERLRTEIHADLARRMIGPGMSTPTGWASTHFDSTIANGDMVFYSPMDYDDLASKTGAPRPTLSSAMFPRQGLAKDPQAMLILGLRSWKYPGDAGRGIFAQSVNAVLSNSRPLVREFKSRGKRMRSK